MLETTKIKIGETEILHFEFDNFIYLYNRFIKRGKSESMQWKGVKIEAGVAAILVANMNTKKSYSPKQIKVAETRA